jgi:hypothetical protein
VESFLKQQTTTHNCSINNRAQIHGKHPSSKEAIWMTKLMKELGYMKDKNAMVIQCDNQSTISLTKNLTQHV